MLIGFGLTPILQSSFLSGQSAVPLDVFAGCRVIAFASGKLRLASVVSARVPSRGLLLPESSANNGGSFGAQFFFRVFGTLKLSETSTSIPYLLVGQLKPERLFRRTFVQSLKMNPRRSWSELKLEIHAWQTWLSWSRTRGDLCYWELPVLPLASLKRFHMSLLYATCNFGLLSESLLLDCLA